MTAMRKRVSWALGGLAVVALGLGLPLAHRTRVEEARRGIYTNCSVGVPGLGKPIMVDDDPEHAVLVLFTQYSCSEGTVVLWGRIAH